MLNIISSALFCLLAHKSFKYFPLKNNSDFYKNIFSCIVFQLLFIFNSVKLTYQSLTSNPSNENINVLQTNTIQNMDFLIGYFVYDIYHLCKTSYTSPFLLHHVIGILILNSLKRFNIPADLIWLYNTLCFIGESTNPIINARYFTKGTTYYNFNVKLIYYTYLLIRMIMFPGFSYLFFKSIYNKLDTFSYNSLKYMFIIIYSMSLFWFRKIYFMKKKLNNY
jgi:hypothetical protein